VYEFVIQGSCWTTTCNNYDK